MSAGLGSRKASQARARRVAWLVAPALALLGVVAPVVGAGPAHAADTIIPVGAAQGTATLTVGPETGDAASSGGTLTGLDSRSFAESQTAFKWMVSAEHTQGAYGFDGATLSPKQPAYDATGDPDKASQVGTCLPFQDPITNNSPVVNNGYAPEKCQWPSVRYTPGAVPVVAQGDQSDIASTDGQSPSGKPVVKGQFLDAAKEPIVFQPGRYLVSVTANGYKIDGAHFDVDGNKGVAAAQVKMHAYPVPLGTLRLRVFKDIAPVDGTYEVGTEPGLAGFVTHLNDVMGEVTTDFWGNRLCTNYVKVNGKVEMGADGFPVIDTANPGGTCKSDAQGDVVIPNLGPDRYTASVVPPSGQSWYQTTTLEGNHDWDMWIAENETGFDTEVTVGGEPVPPVDMGFVPAAGVKPTTSRGGCTVDAAACDTPKQFPASTQTATVKGSAVIINAYVGGTGGVNIPNAGVAGANVRGPLANPLVTMSDLDNGDQLVFMGRGNPDGTFTIPGVPTGNYQLTVWDEPQDYILDSFNVTVNASDAGKTVDVGQKGLVGWYANFRGKVCIDTNANGKCDSGETGVPDFPIGVKYRDNSLLDAGQNGTITDEKGNYVVGEGYPISKFFILEAFNTRYKTTGVTVQADNDPQEHTWLGAGVDLNVLPIIGLAGRVDWAVQPYDTTTDPNNPENGGIAGTVTYDTTRNELDPMYAATEPYQPGIPGLTLHLFAPVQCDPTDPTQIDPVTGAPIGTNTTLADGSSTPSVAGVPDGSLCSADDGYFHAPQDDPANPGTTVLGAVQPRVDTAGKPIDMAPTYTSETWDASTGCQALQHDGTPVDQWAIPQAGNDTMCVEAPMLGIQGVPSDQSALADGGFGQTVNGNYAFATVDHDPSTGVAIAEKAIPVGDYIVKVDIPEVGGKPLYKPTQEEDVNVFDGDVRAPQENFPTAADVSSAGVDQSPGTGGAVSQQPGFWSSCVGALHKVTVTDAGFQNAGGSPFEGQARPMCDSKLVSVRGGQAVAPNFNLFTDVPLPTHFWGLTINDLGLSQDKTQAGYGEAQPLPNVPMGIYDWSGRLVDTVNTDFNGMYEALEPSTSSYNCPLPAGPCPGMYYFKGNDPGQPGHANANYNPRFRTIGTQFQAWPGLWTVTDTAPTQVGVTSVAPGTTAINPVDCSVNAGISATGTDANATPDVMSVSTPYMISGVTTTGGTPSVTQSLPVTNIRISGIGTTASPKTVTLTTTATVNPATASSYDYIQLPRLTNGTNGNTSFPTSPPAAGITSALQLAALNTTNQPGLTAPGGGASRHRIASITAGTGSTTITFQMINLSAAAPNTTAAGVGANVTAQSVTLAVAGTSTPNSQKVVIQGDGFGTQGGNSAVTLTPLAGGSSNVVANVTAWTNNQVTVNVTSGNTSAPAPGAYQLVVRNNNGKTSVNGLTFHVFGGTGATGYNPTVIHVPARPGAAPAVTGEINANTLTGAVTDGDPNTNPENVLQKAVDRAATVTGGQSVVVVWPKTPIKNNPLGSYYENLVVHSNVKIQGVGAGGTYKDANGATQTVLGSRLDGLGFNPDNQAGANWVATVAGITHAGPDTVPDAAVVTYLGTSAYGNAFRGALDGVTVTGGSQADFVTAVNEPLGGTTTPFGAPGALVTQGGGIYLHAAANNVTISNDVIVGNSGSYAGGIRIGTPYDATTGSTGVTITRNRIRDNGGTNLAGGIGIFRGSNGYTVSNNDLCGNFSAEYGGALTHYGVSDNGKITGNRVYLNQSYDEGGGIMVAGELTPNLNALSPGAGTGIQVNGNTIQDNLANDDGGGLRFLSAATVSGGVAAEIDVTNNVIVDNLSAHEGGGIALDDSPNVHITGNTIMKNLTTATAVTSNGQPAPAGISTANNSDALQGALAAGSPAYSRPQDFRDNILWGNLAGTWDPASGTVLGITPNGTGTNAPNVWEVGSVDGIAAIPISWSLTTTTANSQLAPGTGMQSQAFGTIASGAPSFVVKPYDVGVQILTSRAFPSFRQSVIVVSPVTPRVVEDYHLKRAPESNAAPANGTGGTLTATTTSAGVFGLMALDVDGQARPATLSTATPPAVTSLNSIDIGADDNRLPPR